MPAPSSSPSAWCECTDCWQHRLAQVSAWLKHADQERLLDVLKIITPFLGPCHLHWLAYKLPFPCPQLHTLCQPGCTDPLYNLPDTIVRSIVSYLGPRDVARAAQVCRHWQSVLTADWVWRRLTRLALARTPLFPSTPVEDASCTTPSAASSEVSGLSPMSDESSLSSFSPSNGTCQSFSWKDAFIRGDRLRRCWLQGQCHVRTFEGHSGGISCVQFDQDRIVSGSHDKTIRVWNMKTNSPLSVMTLTGHSGEVRCLHLDGTRLVSGSTDTTLKVWDLDIQPEWSSIGCKVTMVGHSDTVRCVQMSKERSEVVSGSYDATIKVWCLRTGECKRTLRGHQGRVLCLFWDCKKDTLVSGSQDQTIKVWAFNTATCLRTLVGHQDAVTCLSIERGKIISGSLDSTIRIWHLPTGECLSVLDWISSEGHTGVVRCLQADAWRIISASDDKTLKIWSLESGERLVTLRSHTDGVTCLQFNEHKIVSGSYDKTVKLWDFTVC